MKAEAVVNLIESRSKGNNMACSHLQMLAAAICLVSVSQLDNPAAEDIATDLEALEGFWSGSWGGGLRDGVVFQPVMAELLIKGDYVELSAFPNVDRLKGTFHCDTSAGELRITPKAQAAGQPEKAIVYSYDFKGTELTLTDSNHRSIAFHRHGVAQTPLANTQVEFVAATGINDAGDLLVTEFTVLQANQTDATCFQPVNRSLKTKQATVLLVQQNGFKKVTVDEARGLLRESTPVVVAYRYDERPSGEPSYRLWNDMGPAAPDSEAVSQTFSRILRPGTLVFIVSASESVPQP